MSLLQQQAPSLQSGAANIQITPTGGSGAYGLGRGSGSTSGATDAIHSSTMQSFLSGKGEDQNDGVGRGEPTGDHCITIDLFAIKSDSARSVIVTTWSEQRNRCSIMIPSAAVSLNTTLAVSTEGYSFLKDVPSVLNSSHSKEVHEVVTSSNSDIFIGSSNDSKELKNKELRRICLIEAFYDHFVSDQTDTSSALSGVEIESALALLLLRCLLEVGKEKEKELQKEKEEAANAMAGKGKKSPKRSSKSAKISCTVSLVVPCGLGQQEAFLLFSAASRAAQFHSVVSQGQAGGCFAYSMRNLTNRAACAVAGALSLQASVRGCLRVERPPRVLAVRGDGARWEAGLVACEGCSAANLLGPDRLHTEAAYTQRDGPGAKGLEEVLRTALAQVT